MNEEFVKITQDELPHEEWLAENQEYLKENPLPIEMRRKVQIASAQWAKYQKAQGEEARAKALDSLMKTSYTVADALQTWKEKDLDEEEPEKTPEKTEVKAENGGGVQIIDGKPVETKKVVEQPKDEQPKEEEENSGNAGKVVATVVGLSVVGWLVSKIFRR
jgi:hypothetical protein